MTHNYLNMPSLRSGSRSLTETNKLRPQKIHTSGDLADSTAVVSLMLSVMVVFRQSLIILMSIPKLVHPMIQMLKAGKDRLTQISKISITSYPEPRALPIPAHVRMINALLGIVTSNQHQTNDLISTHIHPQSNTLVISYTIHGQATLLKGWEDPYYFTGAFASSI